jgi:hypothetical protein
MPGGIEENKKQKNAVRIAGLKAEILTWTSQMRSRSVDDSTTTFGQKAVISNIIMSRDVTLHCHSITI